MTQENIVIRGAREHNLKDVSLEIPRDKLVVITGLSGSGKSSLAFDTIFAEGQRRYVESLSSYARMFLGQMDKPDVDSIEGLSPPGPLRVARRWFWRLSCAAARASTRSFSRTCAPRALPACASTARSSASTTRKA